MLIRYSAEAMPQFGHKDGFDTVSLITGPSHVFLGIRFGDGPAELVKQPPIGSCQHGVLDEARIREAVRSGLAKANAEASRVRRYSCGPPLDRAGPSRGRHG
jgi:hypothetical protein